MTKHHDFLIVIFLFLASLFIFTWGLNTQEIIGFDSRFYLFAKEMLQDGLNFFPTTYHQPYPDYPATSTVFIYFFANALGGLNKLTAVLPSAIMAALTVVFTYLIGALKNKRLGIYAVFFLFLTIYFVKSARGIALDMYPAAITAICFYLIFSADLFNKPHRSWFIYPLLLLSFACRGPIGLVMPAGVICIYYLIDFRIKKFFIAGLLSLLVLITGAIILFSLADKVGGQAFVNDVLRMQVLGRLEHHHLPFYFYVTTGLTNYAMSFPLALLTLSGAFYFIFYKKNQLYDQHLLLKLFAWVMVILIGMSIPAVKKTRYILPLVPAIALLAAYPFAYHIQNKFFAQLRLWGMKLFLYFPAILFLLTEIIFYYAKVNQLDFPIHYFAITITLIFLQLLIFWLVFHYLAQSYLHEAFILLIASISFVITYIAVIEPIDLYFNRSRDFVMAIENQRVKQHAELVFYKEGRDGLPIKYLVNSPYQAHPIFVTNIEEYQMKSPVFFITSKKYFTTLPQEKFNIIASDSLGRVPVVVFTKK